MPEMDGYEAAYKIRQFEKGRYGGKAETGKQIPIIAMTASVSRDDIDKCMEAGMNDHIGLPMDAEDVLKKLRSYLRAPNL